MSPQLFTLPHSPESLGNSMHRVHKKLDAWQEGITLTTSIYQCTSCFPKSEAYGLSSQMQRAAVSIPSNIAEGAARNSSREFIRFLSIAGGSLSELDTQVEIAGNLGYITSEKKVALDEAMDSLSKKLAGLIRYQKGKIAVKREK
jgi:four helix bundle protein